MKDGNLILKFTGEHDHDIVVITAAHSAVKREKWFCSRIERVRTNLGNMEMEGVVGSLCNREELNI